MKIFAMNYAGVRFLLYSISTHYTLKEKLMYKDIDQTFVSFQLALDSHYTHLNLVEHLTWLPFWLSTTTVLFVLKKRRKVDCQEYSSCLEAEEKEIIYHEYCSSYEVWEKKAMGLHRRGQRLKIRDSFNLVP